MENYYKKNTGKKIMLIKNIKNETVKVLYIYIYVCMTYVCIYYEYSYTIFIVYSFSWWHIFQNTRSYWLHFTQ